MEWGRNNLGDWFLCRIKVIFRLQFEGIGSIQQGVAWGRWYWSVKSSLFNTSVSSKRHNFPCIFNHPWYAILMHGRWNGGLVGVSILVSGPPILMCWNFISLPIPQMWCCLHKFICAQVVTLKAHTSRSFIVIYPFGLLKDTINWYVLGGKADRHINHLSVGLNQTLYIPGPETLVAPRNFGGWGRNSRRCFFQAMSPLTIFSMRKSCHGPLIPRILSILNRQRGYLVGWWTYP